MRIRCPECHFERDIDTTNIPATATVATCPKCGNRFRFRDPETGRPLADQGESESESPGQATPPQAKDLAVPSPDAPKAPHLSTEQEGDDPLPPGAVIPKLDDDHNARGTTGPSDALHAPGTHDVPKDVPKDDAKDDAPPAKEDAPKRHSWLGLKKAAPRPDQPTDDPHDESGFPFRATPGDEQPETSGPDSRRAEEDDSGVPWEQPEKYGFFPSFYHTILRVMFRPQDFFSQLRGASPNASLMRPACFYVLLSFFQTVIGLLWTMNSFKQLSQTATDPQTLAHIDMFMQGMSTPLLLLVTPFLMLLQLFLFAAFYHLMIRLAQPDKADFNTVVRVIAYSAAPLVICVVPVVGSSVASFWFVASTFIGCKYALGLSWSKTTLALVPLFLLALAVMLALVQASLMLASGA